MLLVGIQLRQVKGNVGEAQPKSGIGVHLEGLDTPEEEDVAHVKLHLAQTWTVEKNRLANVPEEERSSLLLLLHAHYDKSA